MRVRYLVVHPDLGFIFIDEMASSHLLGFALTPSNRFSYSLSGLSYPNSQNNREFVLILSGFDLTARGNSRDFDIYTELASSSNTRITIDVSTGISSLLLDYISHTIVAIDTDRMVDRVGDGFPRGSVAVTSGNAVRISNSSTLMLGNNSFFGVRSFHLSS
jgi:hypothetical protein